MASQVDQGAYVYDSSAQLFGAPWRAHGQKLDGPSTMLEMLGCPLQNVMVMRIVGGLGSQLHKLAIGMLAAKHLGKQLSLDRSRYQPRGVLARDSSARDYALDLFDFSPPESSTSEVHKAQGYGYRLSDWLVTRQMSALPGGIRYEIRQATSKNSALFFDFRYAKAPLLEELAHRKNVQYLAGEFGLDFRILSDIRENLIGKFEPLQQFSISASNLHSKIVSGTSIAVHVRRGDYLKTGYFPTQSVNYYLRAISHCASPNSTVYVFSDDPQWCKELLVPYIDFPTVLVEGLLPTEEFALMSRARSIVISNSGFSGMAAWLSQTATKVVCPSSWFTVEAHNRKQICMLPTEWEILPSDP